MSHVTLTSQAREELEKELAGYLKHKERNFARILTSLKRLFDRWAMERLTKEVHPGMKVGFMPFLMHIGVNGTTSGILAQHLLVTKQAMSKTLKELQELGLIDIRPNPNDARSQLIFLSDFGLDTVVKSRRSIGDLTARYMELIGEEQFQQCMSTLLQIEQLHLETPTAESES
jgi:DNA-binding MarR family transcriptional regulator